MAVLFLLRVVICVEPWVGVRRSSRHCVGADVDGLWTCRGYKSGVEDKNNRRKYVMYSTVELCNTQMIAQLQYKHITHGPLHNQMTLPLLASGCCVDG